MLIVLLHNTGITPSDVSSYEAEVRVNEHIIWRGRVDGHYRPDGWQVLLEKLAMVGKMGDHGTVRTGV